MDTNKDKVSLLLTIKPNAKVYYYEDEDEGGLSYYIEGEIPEGVQLYVEDEEDEEDGTPIEEII